MLPTLEAVLSEFEADSDVASEFGMPVPHATPTPSIGEDSTIRTDGRGGGGSIMRYTLLHGISAQLSSAAERVNAGAASSCAVAAFIAIGTSHGHILNFDVTQTLRWAHQDKHGQVRWPVWLSMRIQRDFWLVFLGDWLPCWTLIRVMFSVSCSTS